MVGSSFCHNVDKINRIYDKNMIYILTSLIMVREDCKTFTYHVPPLAEEQELSEIDSLLSRKIQKIIKNGKSWHGGIKLIKVTGQK